MENKGLNIFNTKYVLASKRHRDHRLRETSRSVVGHEGTFTTGPAAASLAAAGSSCR
jgi:hypothetical protein